MAVALATLPLPPPPSMRRCRSCSCTISRSDSQSSGTSTTSRRPAVILPSDFHYSLTLMNAIGLGIPRGLGQMTKKLLNSYQGLGNNTNDYQKLGLILKDYGVPGVIAKVSRIDWLRNAAGLVDPNYWKGTLRPRPVLNWYLKRVEEAVYEVKKLVPDSSISLIGHSAGGWLARVYLQEFGASDVSLLLTLGTPHLAPPKGVSGVIDQTRGLLNYLEKNCAKAVYTPELRYVCIAGRYIQGARLLGLSNNIDSVDLIELDQQVGETVAVNTSMPASASLQARFIGQGYKQVCGLADVWGDGVVPEMSAHLDGALNMSLDGVYHSPVGSDDEKRPWYGSPAVVEQWIHHLLD